MAEPPLLQEPPPQGLPQSGQEPPLLKLGPPQQEPPLLGHPLMLARQQGPLRPQPSWSCCLRDHLQTHHAMDTHDWTKQIQALTCTSSICSQERELGLAWLPHGMKRAPASTAPTCLLLLPKAAQPVPLAFVTASSDGRAQMTSTGYGLRCLCNSFQRPPFLWAQGSMLWGVF